MCVYTYQPGKAPSSVREQYANAYAERRLRQNRFSSIRPKVKPFPLVRLLRPPPLSAKNYFVRLRHVHGELLIINRRYSPYNPVIVSRGRIGLFVFKQIDPSPFTTNVHVKSRRQTTRRRDFHVLHGRGLLENRYGRRFYVGFSSGKSRDAFVDHVSRGVPRNRSFLRVPLHNSVSAARNSNDRICRCAFVRLKIVTRPWRILPTRQYVHE